MTNLTTKDNQLTIENKADYTDDKKKLYKAVEEFGEGLSEMPSKKAIKKLEKSKNKLEKIARKNNLNIEKVFPEFHDYALNKLGESMRYFYTLRNSEGSEELDYSVWLTKFLKVPAQDYVSKVIGCTPIDYGQKELENMVETENLSEEQVKGIIKNLNQVLKSNYKYPKYVSHKLKYSPKIKELLAQKQENQNNQISQINENNPNQLNKPKNKLSGLLKMLGFK